MTAIELNANDRRLFRQLGDRWDDEKSYRRRPVEWCDAKPGHQLHKMQRDIAESVRDNRYTAVHSAHEIGKSLVAADLIAWWIDVHPPGEAFVVSTAPTAQQVSAVLWREIGKTHKLGNLPGRINRSPIPSWYLGDELVGYGRKPSDYEESAFNGIHARYVLVVIDEACGVVKHLYNAIRSLVANEHSRVLAIGNPDDPGSHFKEICEPDSIWNVIHLDALRTPNFTRDIVIGDDEANPRYPLTAALMEAERIPYSVEKIRPDLRDVLVSPLYCEESLTDWCGVPKNAADTMEKDELLRLVASRAADSPIFTSKVRGLFPSATRTGVIPLGWIELAIGRWKDWVDAGAKVDAVPNPTRRVVGIDVAYGGMDETVLAIRFGDAITKLTRYRNADTIETAEHAVPYLAETGSLAVVDVIGIGAGVYDSLRRWRQDSTERNHHLATVIPFNASAKSDRPDIIGQFKFANARAAAWWKMRQLLDPSRGSTVMLPDDDRMKAELSTVKYKHLAGGIIQIESKDDIRKRLGRSTDAADAVIQAFWPDGLNYTMDPDEDYSYKARESREAEDFSYAGQDRLSAEDLVRGPGIMGRTPKDTLFDEIQSW